MVLISNLSFPFIPQVIFIWGKSIVEFYNKFFVLKRAKNDLNDKESERFKREFDVMNELKSPFVLEVHRYDEEKNEYYMEYADETLKKFI